MSEERKAHNPPLDFDTNAVLLGVSLVLSLVFVEVILFYLLPQNGYYGALLYTGFMAVALSVLLYVVGTQRRSASMRGFSTAAFCCGTVLMLEADLATPVTAFLDTNGINPNLVRVPLLVFILCIVGIRLGVHFWLTASKNRLSPGGSRRENRKGPMEGSAKPQELSGADPKTEA